MALLLLVAGCVAVKKWTGRQSQAWDLDDNWSPTGVPTADDDVVFSLDGMSSISVTVSVGSNTYTIKSLTVTGSVDGKLIIPGPGTFVVTGDVLVDGSIQLQLTSGTLSSSAGRLTVASKAGFDFQAGKLSMKTNISKGASMSLSTASGQAFDAIVWNEGTLNIDPPGEVIYPLNAGAAIYSVQGAFVTFANSGMVTFRGGGSVSWDHCEIKGTAPVRLDAQFTINSVTVGAGTAFASSTTAPSFVGTVALADASATLRFMSAATTVGKVSGAGTIELKHETTQVTAKVQSNDDFTGNVVLTDTLSPLDSIEFAPASRGREGAATAFYGVEGITFRGPAKVKVASGSTLDVTKTIEMHKAGTLDGDIRCGIFSSMTLDRYSLADNAKLTVNKVFQIDDSATRASPSVLGIGSGAALIISPSASLATKAGQVMNIAGPPAAAAALVVRGTVEALGRISVQHISVNPDAFAKRARSIDSVGTANVGPNGALQVTQGRLGLDSVMLKGNNASLIGSSAALQVNSVSTDQPAVGVNIAGIQFSCRSACGRFTTAGSSLAQYSFVAQGNAPPPSSPPPPPAGRPPTAPPASPAQAPQAPSTAPSSIAPPPPRAVPPPPVPVPIAPPPSSAKAGESCAVGWGAGIFIGLLVGLVCAALLIKFVPSARRAVVGSDAAEAAALRGPQAAYQGI